MTLTPSQRERAAVVRSRPTLVDRLLDDERCRFCMGSATHMLTVEWRTDPSLLLPSSTLVEVDVCDAHARPELVRARFRRFAE